MSALRHLSKLPVRIRTRVGAEIHVILVPLYLFTSTESSFAKTLVEGKTRQLDWTQYDPQTVQRAVDFMYTADNEDEVKNDNHQAQPAEPTDEEITMPSQIKTEREMFSGLLEAPGAPWSRTRAFICSSSSTASISSSLQFRDEQGSMNYIQDDDEEVLGLTKLWALSNTIDYLELKRASFEKMALVLDSITSVTLAMNEAISQSSLLLEHTSASNSSRYWLPVLLAHFILLHLPDFMSHGFSLSCPTILQRQVLEQIPNWLARGKDFQGNEKHRQVSEKQNLQLRRRIRQLTSKLAERGKALKIEIMRGKKHGELARDSDCDTSKVNKRRRALSI